MARGRPSKKLEIATCAKTIFQKQGYQGTSIDQVVALSGVSKPTVYSNFASKQTLWLEVMKQVIASSEADIQSVECKRENFLTGWIEVWEKWHESAERLCLYRILLGESKKMEKEAVALFSEFEFVLSSKLEKTVKEGEINLNEVEYSALYSISYYLFISKNLYPNKINKKAENKLLLEEIFLKMKT